MTNFAFYCAGCIFASSKALVSNFSDLLICVLIFYIVADEFIFHPACFSYVTYYFSSFEVFYNVKKICVRYVETVLSYLCVRWTFCQIMFRCFSFPGTVFTRFFSVDAFNLHVQESL